MVSVGMKTGKIEDTLYIQIMKGFTVRMGCLHNQENWHVESQTQIFLKNLLKFLGISGTAGISY